VYLSYGKLAGIVIMRVQIGDGTSETEHMSADVCITLMEEIVPLTKLPAHCFCSKPVELHKLLTYVWNCCIYIGYNLLWLRPPKSRKYQNAESLWFQAFWIMDSRLSV
jgi:hypothetical protein